MEQAALLPLRRKACCGFFCPKNPMASAGIEPAIGQHADHYTTEAAMLRLPFIIFGREYVDLKAKVR
jgi:hypothetical protein